MSRFGLIPIVSYKDPALSDEVCDDLSIHQWVAQTAVQIPTVLTDTSESEPKLSVVMRVLSATGHSRKDAVDKLRREISYRAQQVPELQFSEIEGG